MKLNNLEIIFENCESITVAGDNIKFFRFMGITTELFYTKPQDDVEVIETSDSVLFVFKKEADVPYSPFDLGIKTSSVFRRIQAHNDVTSFILNFDDGSSRTIRVDWEDDEYETYNELQNSEIVDGELILFINRNLMEE